MTDNFTDMQQTMLSNACFLGYLDIVKIMCSKIDPTYKNNYAAGNAVQNGQIDVVKYLISDHRVDLTANNYAMVKNAVKHNQLDILKLLLDHYNINPSFNNDELVIAAATYGYLETVRYLVKNRHVDPSADSNTCIINASLRGYTDMVKFLLTQPGVNPADNSNIALIHACKQNHLDVVQTLLADRRVDPCDENNYALTQALNNDNEDIVVCLLKDGRIDPSYNSNRIFRRYCSHIGEITDMVLKHPKFNPSLNDYRLINDLFDRCAIPNLIKLLQHPMVDPSCNNNKFLYMAVCRCSEYKPVVEHLVSDKRVTDISCIRAVSGAIYYNNFSMVETMLINKHVARSAGVLYTIATKMPFDKLTDKMVARLSINKNTPPFTVEPKVSKVYNEVAAFRKEATGVLDDVCNKGYLCDDVMDIISEYVIGVPLRLYRDDDYDGSKKRKHVN